MAHALESPKSSRTLDCGQNWGTPTRPIDAAVASLSLLPRLDVKFKHLAQCLKTNIHPASSHVYPLKLPTRLPEDPNLFLQVKI